MREHQSKNSPAQLACAMLLIMLLIRRSDMRKILVVVFTIALALCSHAQTGATPQMRGATMLTLADGSTLLVGSSFRADKGTNADGVAITLNEAVVEVTVSPQPEPPGPPSCPATLPVDPCRYFIRTKARTNAPQPALMIASLLVAHHWATNEHIAAKLGFTPTFTHVRGNARHTKLPSDIAVLGMLYGQLNAVDPDGAAKVGELFESAKIQLYPPGSCRVLPAVQ